MKFGFFLMIVVAILFIFKSESIYRYIRRKQMLSSYEEFKKDRAVKRKVKRK